MPSATLHAQSTYGQIAGTVRERASGRAIADAQIGVVGQTVQARTDSSGRFLLSRVAIGTHTVQVVRIGMQPTRVSDVLVNTNRTTQLAVELDAVPATLSNVAVVGAASEVLPTPRSPNSRVHMSYEEIRRSPGAIGDVSRLVQALPGVLSGNDTRNDIIARGGSPSENLMLLDGFEVPNINHFGTQGASGGPISMINNELLRDATFYAGGMSSQYGNRLSSLLDIRLREGNRERWRSEFDLSSAGAGIVAEGPLSSKGAFIASARQSFLSLVAPAIGLTAVPYTTNVQFKATYEPTRSDRLWLVGLGGSDRIDLESEADDPDDPMPIGNTRVRGNRWMTGLGWQHLLGSRAYGVLLLSGNTQDRSVRIVEDLVGTTPVFFTDARENELTARYDFHIPATPLGNVAFGVSTKSLSLDSRIDSPFGVRNPYALVPRVDALQASTNVNTSVLGGNIEVSRQVGSRLDLTASVRADQFALASATRVAPRLAAIVHLSPTVSWTGTMGRYFQQVPLVYAANIAQNRELAPMRADHAITGIVWTPREDLKLSAEIYEKRYADYPVARDYPQLSLANSGDETGGPQGAIFPMISSGEGRVRGLELFAQKKFSGRSYGQLSYAHSDTRHAARDGALRRGAYDVPHLATLILGQKRGTAWEFSLRTTYSSGRPMTPLLESLSVEQNRLVFDTSQVNAIRSPDYFRADVRVDRRFGVRNGTLAMYLELQNLTARDNQSERIWNTKTRAADYEAQIGFLPIVGVNWKF